MAADLLLTMDEIIAIQDALNDAHGGWRYIQSHHGKLYGVGWERVDEKLDAADRIIRERVEAARRAPPLAAPAPSAMAKPRTGRCAEKRKPGGCQLHNLHCDYPKCDEYPDDPRATPPAAPAAVTEVILEDDAAMEAAVDAHLHDAIQPEADDTARSYARRHVRRIISAALAAAASADRGAT